jgi:hypothetical protein
LVAIQTGINATRVSGTFDESELKKSQKVTFFEQVTFFDNLNLNNSQTGQHGLMQHIDPYAIRFAE